MYGLRDEYGTLGIEKLLYVLISEVHLGVEVKVTVEVFNSIRNEVYAGVVRPVSRIKWDIQEVLVESTQS